jgi:hypothetical protein
MGDECAAVFRSITRSEFERAGIARTLDAADARCPVVPYRRFGIPDLYVATEATTIGGAAADDGLAAEQLHHHCDRGSEHYDGTRRVTGGAGQSLNVGRCAFDQIDSSACERIERPAALPACHPLERDHVPLAGRGGSKRHRQADIAW